MKQMPQLGDRVRDMVSGYEGVVSGYSVYLWGCDTFLVSRADKDGKPEGEWLDAARLEILIEDAVRPIDYERGPLRVDEIEAATPPQRARGGDKPAPIR